MTLGDIIKEYRETHGMSMADFSRKSGISKAYIALMEKNVNLQTGKPVTPSLQKIKLAADAMNIDFTQLLSQIDGNVVVNQSDNIKKEKERIRSTIAQHPELHAVRLKKFPMLGKVACGTPIMAEQDYETYIMADADIDADYCLTAAGDSMIGARIHNGDIVFIKSMDMVDNGEIAAVCIDDEVTLKRVYYDRAAQSLVLQAENPAYAPLAFRDEELDHVHILGKAVCFQSLVR